VRQVRIGVSSCLLGQKVRYDGGHKEDAFVHRTLADFVDFVPVCPEVEIGLGVPREAIRLEGNASDPRLVAPKSGRDLTAQMKSWAADRLEGLADLGIHGYILKKDSPSCGMEREKVHHAEGGAGRVGTGLFAAALMARFPSLPVEEEGRLNDPALRENFVERVFAYHRLQEFLKIRPSASAFIEFHTSAKMALLAHSPKNYRELGRLVAGAGRRVSSDTLSRYAELFMKTLKVKGTRSKHSNVLYHLMGYLKKDLDSQDKAELVQSVECYRTGLVPLVVPLTLLNHHFRRRPTDWALKQTYLNPYPAELMLRNHV
jgi:uncharacterized protein YbgA (DUF1722 family)/uncharacterized protein YbbK (DUF523 family)